MDGWHPVYTSAGWRPAQGSAWATIGTAWLLFSGMNPDAPSSRPSSADEHGISHQGPGASGRQNPSSTSAAPSDSGEVRVGGMTLARAGTFEAARQYLSGIGVHGYPAYDGYNTGSGPNEVHDGDLLAPTLLNVTPRLRGYYTLLDLRADLERWLQAIPADARLEDADKSDLASLGELFGLVDDKERTPGVGAVTLAKIMHRKRPSFVPLYDRYVWRCYVGVQHAPITRAKNRSWAMFIPLLAQAIQRDLSAEGAWFAQIADLSSNVRIGRLRALDIVAWQAGHMATPTDEPALGADEVDTTPLDA